MKSTGIFQKPATPGFFLVVLLMAFNLGACGEDQVGEQSQAPKRFGIELDASAIDEFLTQCMSQESLPGLAFAVVDSGGILYENTFGVRALISGDNVTKDSIFRGSSLSKPIFAYVVLSAAHAGALDVDQPLYRYLPNPDLEKDERSKLITARLALHHSTGLQNWRRNESLRIQFPPGRGFGYSGEGYMYTQQVLERRIGRELNQIALQQVFTPLGMNSSSYIWRSEFEEHIALGHNAENQQVGLWRAQQASSAGSLYTTVEDYAKFLTYLLKAYAQKDGIVMNMFHSHIDIYGHEGSLGWGLGLGLETTSDGPIAWHWGSDNGYKSFFMLVPAQNLGFVFFCNSSNGLNIAKKVANYFFPGPHPAFDWLEDEYRYRFLADAG